MDGIMYSVRFYLKTIGVFWLSFTRDSRALVSRRSAFLIWVLLLFVFDASASYLGGFFPLVQYGFLR